MNPRPTQPQPTPPCPTHPAHPFVASKRSGRQRAPGSCAPGPCHPPHGPDGTTIIHHHNHMAGPLRHEWALHATSSSTAERSAPESACAVDTPHGPCRFSCISMSASSSVWESVRLRLHTRRARADVRKRATPTLRCAAADAGRARHTRCATTRAPHHTHCEMRSC